MLDALAHQAKKLTGSQIHSEIGRNPWLHGQAVRLGAKARADYELYKEEHAVWLEAKKTAARIALEEEKAAGQLKKQISEAMIMDQVRASWPDEFMAKVKELKGFQAAVHALEKLPESFQMRSRALVAQKDMILALGAGVTGGKADG